MSEHGKTIAATGNSLDIVHLIESREGARLSEIARRLDLSKSTVHSHLTTLRKYGYVTKEGEIYHLSLKFFHLGQYTRNRNVRYRLAAEKTRELAEQLNHSIDFDVETNGQMLTLFHEADESAEVGLDEGDYLYVHTSSTGKAVLAELPEERIAVILDQWGMPRETDNTLTEPAELATELERIRERGFAIVNQEWLEGLRAVGVAVTLPDGRPFGGLSAGGPTYRLTDETIQTEIAPTLLRAAKELEEEVGGVVA